MKEQFVGIGHKYWEESAAEDALEQGKEN